jgi:Fe-S-cluster containining protein
MDAIKASMVEVRQHFAGVKGPNLAKALHTTVDELSEKMDIKSKIQCGKQECSYCCHSSIGISPIEAEYIRANATYTIDEQLQEKQRTTDYKKLSFADKACIMLKNGKCQIYKYRPILCRNHNIALGEDPLNCLKQNSLPGGALTSEIRSPVLEAINFYSVERSFTSVFKNIADYDWNQFK